MTGLATGPRRECGVGARRSRPSARPTADGVDLVLDGLRAFGDDRDLTAVRSLITAAALTSVPAASDAALSVCSEGRLSTAAQTSPVPLAVDALQYRLGGPCVDAANGVDPVLHAADLRTDTRWPDFAQAAVRHTPVQSVLSYRLFIGSQDGDALGSLNLYATEPGAFDSDAVRGGQRLADYASVTLAYAAERQKAVNLERALERSRDIGAAVGILMTRHLVTREQAFDLLRAASMHTHRKLRDLVEHVIHTGDLTGFLPATADAPEPRSRRAR